MGYKTTDSIFNSESFFNIYLPNGKSLPSLFFLVKSVLINHHLNAVKEIDERKPKIILNSGSL